jgi:hypothetical protein
MEPITIEATYNERVDMWVAIYRPLGIAAAAETTAALVDEIDRQLAETAAHGKWCIAPPARFTLRTVRGNELTEETIEVGLAGASNLARDARWARSTRHSEAMYQRMSAKVAFMGWFMLLCTAATIVIRLMRT